MSIKEFVEDCFRWTGGEEITVQEAERQLEAFRESGFELPEGITGEAFAAIWNELCLTSTC
ncbi:MAG: hypothetical protein IKO68_08180 [Oscillospiraceae bacterium]|nr:hypothetical protein [Oscillospiraceae bacterium]